MTPARHGRNRLSGIEPRPRRVRTLLTALLLLSGAGLAAVVLLSLGRVAEAARLEAEQDAIRDARAAAAALKAALRMPAVLDLVPPEDRFALRGTTLQVPEAVAWLHPAPPPSPDLVVRDKLERAARAEFAGGSHAEAEALYQQILEAGVLTRQERLQVQAMAAWQAHRAGNESRRDVLLEELHDALSKTDQDLLARPGLSSALGSTALLCAAAGRGLPDWAERLLPFLPAAHGRPLLQRLRDHGVDAAKLHALRGRLAEVVERRCALRELEQRVPALAAAPRPVAEALGERLVLYFPETRRGALTDPKRLAAALHDVERDDLPPIPWSGEPVFAVETAPAAATADAASVVEGLWAIAPRPSLPGVFWSRPGVVALALVALGLVFGLSLFAAFRALRRQADAMRVRADFLTMVTHELKTPLASIRLLSEMLEERRVPADREGEYYGLLAGEAARLTVLIENVLDLGRMERGERAYDLRPCDLVQVVDEAVRLFGPVAARDGVRVEWDADGLSAPVCADRSAVLQALINVLDNARKYGAGPLEVTVEKRGGNHPVRFFAVEMRDHGPGIPAAERASVFERFARGAAHRHGSVPGVGLGLHLARAIARRHGGDLVCGEPADGGPGARFTFTFPSDPGAPEGPRP